MCGIGGILRVTPPGERFEPIPEAWADALDESIKHRGPDGCGRFRDKATREDGSIVEVVLVHRRLSIIDHEGGAQPMVSEAGPDGMGRVAVVFNGCLYNHRKLREALEERGHVFETDHSDTEVWVHLYREATRNQSSNRVPDYGVECEIEWELWQRTIGIEPDGMFATAIWDQQRGSLSFFQDPHLEKPLHLRHDEHTVAFSSSTAGLCTLLRHPGDALPFCVDQLSDWICLGFHASQTPWINIRQNAGYLSFPDDYEPWHAWRNLLDIGIGLLVVAFVVSFLILPVVLIWFNPSGVFGTVLLTITSLTLIWICVYRLNGFITQLRDSKINDSGLSRVAHDAQLLLRESVRLRLDADVPVGCFLSGGIDSSLIAKYAHDADPTIKTFCMRMPDERYDESPYAQQVADIIGCEHHTLDVSPEPAKDLVHLITQLGLPFGDSSILPTYWLCNAAREHVKVALSGDGGDELFVGYERQIAARLMQYTGFTAGLSRFAIRSFRRDHEKGWGDKAARLLEAARNKGYTDLVAIFPTSDRVALLGDKAGELCREKLTSGLDEAVEFDRWHYLRGDLLRKVDTASMSVGLEVRCPFLSHGLWDRIRGVPAKQLVPGGKRKALLREIAYQHFPKELVDRPKQGFSIPIGEWFRSDFGGMRSLLHEKLDRPRPFGAAHDVLDFNMDYVRKITEEHMEQRRDHSQRLFMLTSLAIWSDSLEK